MANPGTGLNSASMGFQEGAKTDPTSPRESVLLIDFGSQYSMLIARRVRESHVYCEIVSHNATWESVTHLNPRGVILSGGPASVYEEGAPLAPQWD